MHTFKLLLLIVLLAVLPGCRDTQQSTAPAVESAVDEIESPSNPDDDGDTGGGGILNPRDAKLKVIDN